MDVSPGPALRRAGVLLASLGLAGCSGTPFGETLTRSFSPGAQAPTPIEAPSPPPPAPGPPAAEATEPELTPPPPKPAAASKTPPRVPSPYRVTIRLPTADPSAPAEALTRALRGAGVPFEVETIERMEDSGANSAEAGTSSSSKPKAGSEATGPASPDSPDPESPSVRPAPSP